MKIVEFNSYSTLDWLALVSRRAADEGLRLRLSQGADEHGSYMKFALGGGMWSAPIYSDKDEPAFVATPRLTVGTDGKPVVS